VIVGHQPTLGEIVARVLGLDDDDWPIKKGAVVWLTQKRGDGRARAVLHAAITPDMV
jgi:phosphohistidine phosphatase